MAIRIIVSDTATGDHANTVKAAISYGYGSDISDQIEIRTGGLVADIAYADSIGAIAVVRSTTGISGYQSTALTYYPDILLFMPLGNNNFIQLNYPAGVIVSCGAGDTENKNNTAYGVGLEFWDDDLSNSVSADLSSFSNGVIAGKLLKIKDTLNCSWWEARYRARQTANKTEDNRTDLDRDLYNGYGKINVTNAIAYSGTIITDPFNEDEPLDEEPETEIEETNIMINKTIDIELTATDNEGCFEFIKGDTFRVVVNVTNNGTIFDMTGYTPILTAMKVAKGTTADIELKGASVDISKANEGQLTFTFNPSDTENLNAGNYFYDIQVDNVTNRYTLIISTIQLIQDITKLSSFYLAHERGIRKATEGGKYKITESINLI